MRIFCHFSVFLAVFLLSACTTPDIRYYSLLPASPNTAAHRSATPVPTPGYAISVQNVLLPSEVDRPQLMFSQTESTELIPLGSALWASPLADQVRTAITGYLTHDLNVLELASETGSAKLPVWLIDVRVHRFQSLYMQRAVLDVSWQLNPVNLPKASASLCGAQIQVPVENGVNAMVQGHQLALRELSSLISAQLNSNKISTESQKVAQVQLKGCTYSKKSA